MMTVRSGNVSEKKLSAEERAVNARFFECCALLGWQTQDIIANALDVSAKTVSNYKGYSILVGTKVLLAASLKGMDCGYVLSGVAGIGKIDAGVSLNRENAVLLERLRQIALLAMEGTALKQKEPFEAELYAQYGNAPENIQRAVRQLIGIDAN
jgi:hypothetical protein